VYRRAMPAVDSGCLVLADISGYTEYLGGVELEHCHDVLAKLMAAVAEQVRGALQVAKFEGDAIFCYDPHDRCDGELLLARLTGWSRTASRTALGCEAMRCSATRASNAWG